MYKSFFFFERTRPFLMKGFFSKSKTLRIIDLPYGDMLHHSKIDFIFNFFNLNSMVECILHISSLENCYKLKNSSATVSCLLEELF